MPLERHQALEIEHEIDALVEDRQRRERALELERQPPGLDVALGGASTEFDEAQHLARQHVADAGDDAARAAVDDAVKHLGVDADHQRNVVGLPGDVFGRVAQRLRAAEFLESDEMRELAAQVEEQFGASLEAVVGAVVDDRRQIDRCGKDAAEMAALGGCATSRATGRAE